MEDCVRYMAFEQHRLCGNAVLHSFLERDSYRESSCAQAVGCIPFILRLYLHLISRGLLGSEKHGAESD
jgi:hypothetical protein